MTFVAVIAQLFIMAFTIAANALSVSPMYVGLKSAGQGSRSVVTLKNDRNRDIMVDVAIERLEVDRYGTITNRTPVDDDFLVFPPSAIVKPLSSQAFRIIWIGEPVVEQSGIYAVTFTKIAPESENVEDRVRVQVNFNYAFSVVTTIAPPSGEPVLSVGSIIMSYDKNGQPVAKATISNSSNVHGTLAGDGFNLTLRDASGVSLWSKRLTQSEVVRSVGLGLIMPYTEREVTISLAELIGDKALLSRVASAAIEVR